MKKEADNPALQQDYLECEKIWIFALLMVVARLLSGVHWLTDIVGGVLLSTGLVTLYKEMI